MPCVSSPKCYTPGHRQTQFSTSDSGNQIHTPLHIWKQQKTTTALVKFTHETSWNIWNKSFLGHFLATWILNKTSACWACDPRFSGNPRPLGWNIPHHPPRPRQMPRTPTPMVVAQAVASGNLRETTKIPVVHNHFPQKSRRHPSDTIAIMTQQNEVKCWSSLSSFMWHKQGLRGKAFRKDFPSNRTNAKWHSNTRHLISGVSSNVPQNRYIWGGVTGGNKAYRATSIDKRCHDTWCYIHKRCHTKWCNTHTQERRYATFIYMLDSEEMLRISYCIHQSCHAIWCHLHERCQVTCCCIEKIVT